MDDFDKKVIDVIKQWFKGPGFHARKLTDTPTDDLQVVNKKYVDAHGGGTPGGSNTQVQFNDGGVFGGSSKFTYDKNLGGAATMEAPSEGSSYILGGESTTYPGTAGNAGLVAGSGSSGGVYGNNGGEAYVTGGHGSDGSAYGGKGGNVEISSGQAGSAPSLQKSGDIILRLNDDFGSNNQGDLQVVFNNRASGANSHTLKVSANNTNITIGTEINSNNTYNGTTLVLNSGNGSVTGQIFLYSNLIQGSGYLPGDILTISGGNSDAQILVDSIDPVTGAIEGITTISGGSGYSTGNNISLTGGTGSGAKVDITIVSAGDGDGGGVNILLGTGTVNGRLNIQTLPTSSAGLSTGDIWVDTTGGLNILKIV